MEDPSKYRSEGKQRTSNRYVSTFAQHEGVRGLNGGSIANFSTSYRRSRFYDDVGVHLWRDPEFQLKAQTDKMTPMKIWTNDKYNTVSCPSFHSLCLDINGNP